MSMWHRTPFDDLFSVFCDFDNLFHRTFVHLPRLGEPGRLLTSDSSSETGPATVKSPAWSSFPRWEYAPAVESYVKDGKIFLRAELPGVDPKDVQVTLTGNRLQLSGEKKASREVGEGDLWIREVAQGRFERSFTLPKGVEGDQIKARFENGVLELSMPTPVEAGPKKLQIEIKPNGGANGKTA